MLLIFYNYQKIWIQAMSKKTKVIIKLEKKREINHN